MENQNSGSVQTERVTGKLRDQAQAVQATLGEKAEQIKDYASDVDSWLRQTAREKPLLTLGVAIGLGFIIGRIASRA